MQAYYRNKRTGEIRAVEQDTKEMFDLQREVDYWGQPKWEQTSFAHQEAVKERAAYGELDESDLGHEDQDQIRGKQARLDVEGVGPEAKPWESLTPAEIEAGLTPDQKAEDLQAMFDNNTGEERGSVFNEAADRIADERKERPAAQPAQGQRARAGGTDEREDVPVASASDQRSASVPAEQQGANKPATPSPAPAGAGSGGQGKE